MIETTVRNYLNQELIESVYLETTSDMPDKYVLLERTGGGEKYGIKSAAFAVQSYANSMYEAAELNERVKEAMFDIIRLDNITDISLDSNYNFTDIRTKKYRYQSVWDMSHW